jgi:hypothetical protein
LLLLTAMILDDMARKNGRAGWWRIATVALLVTLLPLGCASTVKQAAREAAPAAVKEGVAAAQSPETRQNVADILADPRIREATTALTQAVVEGIVDGLTDEQRVARLQHLTDALVTRMGSSFARSFQRDIGPQLAATFADALDRSFERALSPATEARLQAIALAVTRGAMEGAGDALLDDSGQPAPALRHAFGQVVREMAYEGALGFNAAVRDAESRSAGEDSGEVLGMLGTLSDWTVVIPPLAMGAAVLLVIAAIAALAWALSLRRRLRAQGTIAPMHRSSGPLSQQPVSR